MNIETRALFATVAACIQRGLPLDRAFSPGRGVPWTSIKRKQVYRDVWRAGFGPSEIGRVFRRHHTTVIHALYDKRNGSRKKVCHSQE